VFALTSIIGSRRLSAAIASLGGYVLFRGPAAVELHLELVAAHRLGEHSAERICWMHYLCGQVTRPVLAIREPSQSLTLQFLNWFRNLTCFPGPRALRWASAVLRRRG
jgi:hypothetical protein